MVIKDPLLLLTTGLQKPVTDPLPPLNRLLIARVGLVLCGRVEVGLRLVMFVAVSDLPKRIVGHVVKSTYSELKHTASYWIKCLLWNNSVD
jgi:hypothetical protein